MTQPQEEALWHSVNQARTDFINDIFGPLPDQILKITSLIGVWPGGGVYEVETTQLNQPLWLYTSFGLTNPDMPTSVSSIPHPQGPAAAESSSFALTLTPKKQVPSYPDRPGYGYELMILTRQQEEWPLPFLQWAVKTELLNDADFLGRVEQYNGLTIEDNPVGKGTYVNVLVQKAASPLPTTMPLPNGKANLLVVTTITDDEMVWSMNHGKEALLNALQESGVGQVSDINRPSIFHPEPLDIATVQSFDEAIALQKKGLLRKIHLVPLELGGQDVPQNTFYLPKKAAIAKKEFDYHLQTLVRQGKINGLNGNCQYRGKSVVPSAIQFSISGEAGFEHVLPVW